jgi:hypothetical protein
MIIDRYGKKVRSEKIVLREMVAFEIDVVGINLADLHVVSAQQSIEITEKEARLQIDLTVLEFTAPIRRRSSIPAKPFNTIGSMPSTSILRRSICSMPCSAQNWSPVIIGQRGKRGHALPFTLLTRLGWAVEGETEDVTS